MLYARFYPASTILDPYSMYVLLADGIGLRVVAWRVQTIPAERGSGATALHLSVKFFFYCHRLLKPFADESHYFL